MVKGNRVVADVGGNLNVESLQDTARFDSKQQSLGGSVSLGYGKSGGSLSISQNKVDADYASVGERSGIQAGDGGFDVKVKGKTDLVGGVIASTQKAIDEGRNRFDTASLTTRDIQNRDDFNASGFSLSGGYGNLSQGATSNRAAGVEGSAVGFGSVSGRNSGTTTSGVSGIAGNAEVRTGDGSGGLARTFDADKAARDVAAQMQITSTFGQQAAKAGGEYANGKAAELRSQGNEAEASKWDEGGTYRVAMHAVVGGLTGGVNGALGAAASSASVPFIAATINETNLPDAARAALIATAGTVLGASVGNGMPGAAAAFGEVINNCLASACLSIKWDKNAPGYHAYTPAPSPHLCSTAEAGCMDAVKNQLSCNSAPGQPQCSKPGTDTRLSLAGGNVITQYLSPNGQVVINGTSGKEHALDDGYVLRWIGVDAQGGVRIYSYGEGVNKDWNGIPSPVMAGINAVAGPALFTALGIRNQIEVRNQLFRQRR